MISFEKFPGSVFQRNANAKNTHNFTGVVLRFGLFISIASFLTIFVIMYSDFPNSDHWSILGVAGERQDFLYRAYGLSGFIIFLLAAFLSLIVALDIEKYFVPLTVVTVTLFCIAFVFCVCVLRSVSKRNYRRVPGEEPKFEEIELEEIPESRKEDPRRLSINYIRSVLNMSPLPTDSESSSTYDDDPDIQKLLALIPKKNPVTAVADYPISSKEARRILETGEDAYAGDEAEAGPSGVNCEQSAADSENANNKVFRLSRLPFIDSEDGTAGNAERTLQQDNLPNDSNDDADSADKDVSAKEKYVK